MPGASRYGDDVLIPHQTTGRTDLFPKKSENAVSVCNQRNATNLFAKKLGLWQALSVHMSNYRASKGGMKGLQYGCGWVPTF